MLENTITLEEAEVAQRRPSPLPDLLPPVPGLPPELIPDGLRGWLTDVAERAQVPVEFVAAPAVVALGGVIGRTVGIYPKRHDNWLVVPNLWGGIIGRPSMIKSHAVGEALKPLRRLAARATEEHEQGSFAIEAQRLAIEAQIDEAKSRLKSAVRENADPAGAQADIEGLLAQKKSLEQELTERRYFTNDPTVEMVGKLLNENPRGIVVVRDELSGWLRLLDKAGREGDREFYLEAWNGTGSYTYDRIGRGTLHVEALTVSIVGGIQPSKLQPYINNALKGGQGDDGLLQRMQLLVWPDKPSAWRNVDRVPDRDAENRAFEIFQALDVLDPATLVDEQSGDIPALRFAPEAQELFDEWRGQLEHRLRSAEFKDAPAFEAHLAKYRSLMPSLALIFHLVDVVSNRAEGAVTFDAATFDAARKAAQWCDFLEQHARKVYAPELNVSVSLAHQIMEKIVTGDINDGDTVRDVYRHGWSGLATVEDVGSGLEVLSQHNVIWIDKEQTGGAPSAVIRVHPDILATAA